MTRRGLDNFMPSIEKNRILAIGVYVPGISHRAEHISAELLSSRAWGVDLRWATVGEGPIPHELVALTFLQCPERIPKFALLNRLIAEVDLDQYAMLLVVDDDIELPAGFLDRFLAYQIAHDFTLAQPARTHDSFIDHYFVAQLLGVAARSTRFVEIGPLFSLRREGFPLLLPFDETAPMGWGLDFAWPVQLEARGCRLGIIDATPVRHAIRKPVAYYDYHLTHEGMNRFLAQCAHLPHGQAFRALQTYPLGDPQS